MRLHRFALPLGLVVAFSACKKEKPVEVPSALDVFPAIILPPNASFVSKAGSKEALAVLLRTSLKPEAAANYYRAGAPAARLAPGQRREGQPGCHVLYAERGGRPLWVRVYPDREFNATFVEMTGAVAKLHPDSTKAPTDSEAIAAGQLPQPAATFKPIAPPKMVQLEVEAGRRAGSRVGAAVRYLPLSTAAAFPALRRPRNHLPGLHPQRLPHRRCQLLKRHRRRTRPRIPQ